MVPGATQPYAIRLPLADVNRFIEMEDSISNYRASDLLTIKPIIYAANMDEDGVANYQDNPYFQTAAAMPYRMPLLLSAGSTSCWKLSSKVLR